MKTYIVRIEVTEWNDSIPSGSDEKRLIERQVKADFREDAIEAVAAELKEIPF